MLRLLLVCILLCAGGLKANNSHVDPENHPNAHLLPDNCGDIYERRTDAPVVGLYEFPWMALISYRTHKTISFRCTGTIINSRYILTAANCVKDKNIVGVRVGEYNMCTETDCQGAAERTVCESHIQDISVEDHKVHEDFTTKSTVITNNIALLRLKEPIDFSFKNVAPICLPISKTSRNISLESKTVTLAGWKLRKIEDSCDLSKTNLPVVTRNECQKKYETLTTSKNVRISEDQLCADEQTNDACGIVSGAPLMLEADHQGSRRIVQYGLSSHGPNRCMSSYPGVYTDVTKHVDWILSNIKE